MAFILQCFESDKFHPITLLLETATSPSQDMPVNFRKTEMTAPLKCRVRACFEYKSTWIEGTTSAVTFRWSSCSTTMQFLGLYFIKKGGCNVASHSVT